MYVNRNYGFFMTFNWSKGPFIIGLLYSMLISAFMYITDFGFTFPWQPISLIGIAVAFYLGFKNNSSYDRTWEARKIWGGIVNTSRAFGSGIIAFVQGDQQDAIRKELIYRHIAWMTALRYQLRLPRAWEHKTGILNRKYLPSVAEQSEKDLFEALSVYIKPEEIADLKDQSNFAAQIPARQSERLQELRNLNYYEDFRHMELYHHINDLFAEQGRSERIKNFPFPRQYATTALWLTFVFCAFVPFGMADVFKNYNQLYLFSPLFSALVIWIFFLMEKIGDYSENPFEGSYNDVPITSIARGIEIDLREMIGDAGIPGPVPVENGFLM